jgi:hypothetical protein
MIGSLIASHAGLGTFAPIDFRFIVIFEVIFYLGFGAWGHGGHLWADRGSQRILALLFR